MPKFTSFRKCHDKLNKEELIRAIRFAIATEFEAIQIYEEIKEATECKKTMKVLNEIIEDEKIHIGNFIHLLKDINPDEIDSYKEGCKEADILISDD